MDNSILLLDNFDSFTYLLADYLQKQGLNCIIERNNADFEKIIQKSYSAVVLSPGPGLPHEAGILMKIIDYYHKKIPILGICLGHQAIAEYFGSEIAKARNPMHGKISEVYTKDDELFEGIPKKFKVTRYHSMVIKMVSDKIEPLAFTEENEIMIIKHNVLPIYGIQYHPEAELTEFGDKILKNWASLIKIPN